MFYNSTVIYLEGNLETKIFTDPVTGLVRRIREVAIRRNGINGSTPKVPFVHSDLAFFTYLTGTKSNLDLCFSLPTGRVVFLGKAGDMQQPSSAELRGVGYY